VHLFPWLGVLARKGLNWVFETQERKKERCVFAIATSAAPECLFSTAGNMMTMKLSRLKCDNMKELVYLLEVWPLVREWETVNKMRLERFFVENYLQCLLLSLVC